jgi:peptidoglycan/LPS O-acetylase OafA/YrhL
LVHISKNNNYVDVRNLLVATTLNILFLPYFGCIEKPCDLSSGVIFPLDNPAWSLFFELFVNILFFIYIRYCKKINLISLVAFSYFIMIVLYSIYKAQNPGWGKEGFLLGFPRVIAEFFIGVVIYKLHASFNREYGLVSLLLAIVLLIYFWDGNIKLGWTTVTLLSPVFILLYSSVSVISDLRGISNFMGSVSYPLYVLHIPIYNLLTELFNFNFGTSAQKVLLISTISMMVSFSVIALDEQVRKKMKLKLFPIFWPFKGN